MIFSSTTVVTFLLEACAATGIALSVLLVRWKPKYGFLAWIITVCFVPIWIGVEVKTFFSAITVVSVVLITGLVHFGQFRLNLVDWFMISLIGTCIIANALGLSSLPANFAITIWAVAYLFGRLVLVQMSPAWIYHCVAVSFTAVAILAIIEFLTGVNIFVLMRMKNSLYEIWAPLQIRGGMLRVEGAFGHSIALGTCLAMAIPLAFSSNFKVWVKVLMIGCMLSAATLTFSRTGMICSILALLISILGTRNSLSIKTKIYTISVLAIITASVLPFIGAVFESAGEEAAGSANYRGDLLSLLSDMRLIGISPSFTVTPNGEATFGAFRSIDNALVLLGLTYGLVPLILMSCMLLLAIFVVASGRAEPATVAVVAAIPSLVTAALLTQYEVFFWFMIGVAGVSQVLRRDTDLDKHQFGQPKGGVWQQDLRTVT